MAALSGTILASKIVPTDDQDLHATHDEKWGQGGYRTVATLADRDAITQQRRRVGMLVNVTAELHTTYRLEGGITNADWVPASLGGGGTSKRRIPFYNTAAITVPDVTDYSVINIWEEANIYRPSLWNQTSFNNQQFNRTMSAGAKKLLEYEVQYDIQDNLLLIQLSEPKTGLIVIM